MKKKKWNNIPTKYKGISFDSKKEAVFAKWLDEQGHQWTRGKDKIPYTLPEAYYKPDFHLTSTVNYIEYKGFFPYKDRCKMLAVKEQHPDKNFILVFANPNTKISKGPKGKTYRQWAEDNGFTVWEDGSKLC